MGAYGTAKHWLRLLALSLGSCGACVPAAEAPRDVLLITLDTTRADRLGCYGNPRIRTPHLDALAREGTLFENAFTPVPSTLPAHASILTGTYPASHGIHDNGIYRLEPAAVTLAERLRPGRATAAFVAAFVLDRQFGLDQGFDVYDDAMREPLSRDDAGAIPPDLPAGTRRWLAQLASPFQRSAAATTDAALRWLAEAPDRPFFLWLHYFDPHQPYMPPGSQTRGDGYAGPIDGDRQSYFRLMRENGWTRHHPQARPHVERMVWLYDRELEFVDASIGRLVEALGRLGRWDRTLVVVVGDHGESFGEHEQIWEHNGELFDEVVRIPLLIRVPGGRGAGRRVPGLVRSIDVAPTILDLLGEGVPTETQGASLVPLLDGRSAPEREVLLEARRAPQLHPSDHSLLGLRSGRHKLVLRLDAEDRVMQRQLFDLAEDPGEQQSTAGSDSEQAAALAERLLRQHRELAAKRNGLPLRSLDDLTSEGLRALGYLDPSR